MSRVPSEPWLLGLASIADVPGMTLSRSARPQPGVPAQPAEPGGLDRARECLLRRVGPVDRMLSLSTSWPASR
jgi:hypothetical protein